MVDERTDILQQHIQFGIVNIRCAPALQKIGNQTLFIHDILADEHCILL